tara:strand:+ start:63 stop:353 length:291 start_codon:yes stop_codon:yes gene_type:complete
MTSKEYLEIALGGNMTIATLKPLAIEEIMTDFAKQYHKEQLTLNGVVSSFSIGFAEYIAKKHYKLLNFIGKIHYWGNGESYKTSEQLLKDYKETIT